MATAISDKSKKSPAFPFEKVSVRHRIALNPSDRGYSIELGRFCVGCCEADIYGDQVEHCFRLALLSPSGRSGQGPQLKKPHSGSAN